ncbi:MAG: DNA mismatch repair protein MutS [Candidatus Margulisiibacteriota bacterium]
MSDLTPMARQYQEIKAKHKDAILFYRLGDFYEMFYEDAETASRELDLVLTGRGQEENRMPMCGIPYHAAENYISRLIGKGYKVAICEQMEDPKAAKGVVKREVIRIITPGTVIESNLLSEKSNNYLLAITKEGGNFGLAYADASTGEFNITQIDDVEKLYDEIHRINPAELLISDLLLEPEAKSLGSKEMRNREFYSQVPHTKFTDTYDVDIAEDKLKGFFKVKTLNSFGLEAVKAGWGAAAAILDYLKETQKTSLDQIKQIKPYHTSDFMFIDSSTRNNLELVQTIRDRSYKGSLLWVLDRTKTSMGARRLKQWLLQPLLGDDKINERLDSVEELFSGTMLRAELGAQIKNISDVERVTGRIASESANAKDLVALKQSLEMLPKLKHLLGPVKSKLLKDIHQVNDFKDILDLINKAIVDDPPFALKEGGLIKQGYDPGLDEVMTAAREGKDWIAKLENEERARSGIKSLKVGYTKVFGYYIEVTNSNLAQVPPNYIRKQTLVNCERFITPELKEKESLILNADERMKEMEYKVFCSIRSKIAEQTAMLQELARIIGRIDVLLSLSEAAVENNYVRPKLSENQRIRISEGRHPVVEKMIGGYRFVPNDLKMDNKESRFLLITGPNMAGKSTYMRQAALICLMAQIGSFVPAKTAELCIVDRIFTRIGAMDDIFSGQSTFMIEMTEAANILHNATGKSLIILDEIGRGTATFDGMSIAAAIAEYIHENIKAKTLFATHYHEITQLADKHPGMKNMNVMVKEEGDHITFLHKIVPGSADRSYGIQVAKLAGLPKQVVERAKEIYNNLEMVENDLGKTKKAHKYVKADKNRQDQPSLF